MKTVRLAPGEYNVSDGDLVVSISRFDHLPRSSGQWVARADWTRDLYTDPLFTKANAVQQARLMIQDEIASRSKPLIEQLADTGII